MSPSGWEVVVGLEVHVQLLTRAKLFSPQPNAFGRPPNTAVDDLVAGFPGALPVANEEAIRLSVVAGLALDAELQSRSVFERKHYFYPDLPKGYQISQYARPLFLGGRLRYRTGGGETRTCRLTRIHLEEDAGKTLHRAGQSLVDLNRAGVPLLEIVTEPDLRSASDAADFLRELRRVARFAGVSDGNMEEGSLRCDANVSVRPGPDAPLGTRAEIKNLNSFRFVERAIRYEADRQMRLLARGEPVVQETRLYDDVKDRTFAMRGKEYAEDYRYMPDPDLPAVVLEEAFVEEAARAVPRAPLSIWEEYTARGVPDEAARILTDRRDVNDFFEAVLARGPDAAVAAPFVVNDVLPRLAGPGGMEGRVEPADVAELIALLGEGTSRAVVASALDRLVAGEMGTRAIVQELEKGQLGGEELGSQIEGVLAEHPEQVTLYREGRTKLIGFFVGKVLAGSGGRIDPRVVKEELERRLGSPT
jgi:aspartyl-tRNA(Asn)/glutamyl-tRNA(Gln) amidotransferase subunit B